MMGRVDDVHLEEHVGLYGWTCIVLLEKHIAVFVHERWQDGLNDGFSVPRALFNFPSTITRGDRAV